jgi:hypothetical protein
MIFEHSTFTQLPDPSVLVNYLTRNFPGATYHAVYEAGYSGFWIHDQLRGKGIDCIVVNPADIPTTDKERTGKTDKADCLTKHPHLPTKSLFIKLCHTHSIIIGQLKVYNGIHHISSLSFEVWLFSAGISK